MHIRRTMVALAALTGAALTSGAAGAQEQKFVTIGSGAETGVYYAVATNICKLLGREANVKCNAPAGGGSVANLTKLRTGEIEFGVAQSDTHFNSLKGENQFKDQGADPNLRSVFSLHPESFTVVARKDANVKEFSDLKGKRVNIGNPGSGQRATMDAVLSAKGWTVKDFSLASELEAKEQAQALCDNKVDAMVYVVGHPNGSIQEATTSCDSGLVPVTGPDIDKLVSTYPYYAKSAIPGGMYRGSDTDTSTFGVRATLVTSAKVPDDVVYNLTKSVFDNMDRFKKQHPAFQILEPKEMVKQGLSAPLHPGAEKYFKEKGLM